MLCQYWKRRVPICRNVTSVILNGWCVKTYYANSGDKVSLWMDDVSRHVMPILNRWEFPSAETLQVSYCHYWMDAVTRHVMPIVESSHLQKRKKCHFSWMMCQDMLCQYWKRRVPICRNVTSIKLNGWCVKTCYANSGEFSSVETWEVSFWLTELSSLTPLLSSFRCLNDSNNITCKHTTIIEKHLKTYIYGRNRLQIQTNLLQFLFRYIPILKQTSHQSMDDN